MAAVHLDNISKSFGATSVLQGINLDIKHGEFLTLLGPSGCGKSTLLRIIAGLETQTSGSVSIGDRQVNTVAPKDRDVAMVFQTYALYPHLTVRGNMAVPLRMRQLTRVQRWPIVGRLMPGAQSRLAAIDGEIEAVAASLGLTDLLGRRPAQLSGGQRQRVALGRAMVRHPAVFLMDEPLSNLDAERRMLMRAELAALHKRLGSTFIYVTHDQAEAMTLSTRVVVMDSGRILQVGTPREIYDRPKDRRVAEFVGSPPMNMLPGRITDKRICFEGRILEQTTVGGEDRPIIIGIRADALQIANVSDPTALETRIETIEHLGGEVHLTCMMGDAHRLFVRARPKHLDAVRSENRIGIRIEPNSIHLFEENGLRVIGGIA